MPEFEPRIVVFGCNWCSYAGADLAGVSRMQYPATTRVIRVMCSGRVTSGFILEAFRLGADGVLVTGCHPGDCHYISGNETAATTVERTRKLLALLGIESDRLRLEWISAAEGARFARLMAEFTAEIQDLGPRPDLGPSPDSGPSPLADPRSEDPRSLQESGGRASVGSVPQRAP